MKLAIGPLERLDLRRRVARVSLDEIQAGLLVRSVRLPGDPVRWYLLGPIEQLELDPTLLGGLQGYRKPEVLKALKGALGRHFNPRRLLERARAWDGRSL